MGYEADHEKEWGAKGFQTTNDERLDAPYPSQAIILSLDPGDFFTASSTDSPSPTKLFRKSLLRLHYRFPAETALKRG